MNQENVRLLWLAKNDLIREACQLRRRRQLRQAKASMIKGFKINHANVVSKKITQQMLGEFEPSPERKFMMAIVVSAIHDAIVEPCDAPNGRTARQYIQGPMHHIELCGADADWSRELIFRALRAYE